MGRGGLHGFGVVCTHFGPPGKLIKFLATSNELLQFEAAGLQLMSFNQTAHESIVTLLELQQSRERINPFVHGEIPPELRESLPKLYMEKAVDYQRPRRDVE